MTREMLTKACEQCGAVFEQKRNETDSRFVKRRFCSRACYNASRPEVSREPRTCERCGASFQADRSRQRWCSVGCATKSTGEQRAELDRVHIVAGRRIERVFDETGRRFSLLVDGVEVAQGQRDSMYHVQQAVERTIERLEQAA
jgi:hypothetical protein